MNSNFDFQEDNDTQYAQTSTGQPLPFKLFHPNETDKESNLLKNLEDNNTDFALMERRFVENKSLEFLGTEKIQSHNDVAWLFKALEDEAVEHAFLLYQFEDSGYFVQHISTGSFNAALIDNKALIGNVLQAKPNSVTLVHNHPSGNLKASKADFKCLSTLRKALRHSDTKVEPGVIINLRSGKYLVFDEESNEENIYQRKNITDKIDQVSAYSFSKQVLVENFQPYKVTSSRDVAAFLTAQKFGVSDKTEMLVLNQQMNIVGKFLLPQNGHTNFIAEKVAQFGGVNCILYGNNITNDEVNFYNRILQYSNISILDGILFKSDNASKTYKSFMDEGLLNIDTIASDNLNNTREPENNYKKMENSEQYSPVINGNERFSDRFEDEMQNTSEGFSFDDAINENFEIIGGKMSEIALQTAKDPHYIFNFDKDTQNVINIYIQSENIYNQLSARELLDVANIWAKEIGSPTRLSQGLSINQRDEKQAYFYRKFESQFREELKHSPESAFNINPVIISMIGIPNDYKTKEKFDALSPDERKVIINEGREKAVEIYAFLNAPMNLTQNYAEIREKFDKALRLMTDNSLNKFINNPNSTTMEQNFDQMQYLKDQLKYLGFGESENLHKDLENGIKSKNQEFEIKTSSDKALPGNKVDFNLKFNKPESGGVFLNSYQAHLTKDNGEELSHNFPVNRENTFTAKEAVNLLEGRSVKIEFNNPKSDQKETAFVQFNFEEPKTDKGNYMFQNFYQNYGVDTEKIVEKSNLIFDKPEYKENTIKSLEKGNVVKVKFEMNDKVVEGKAVLNPQYKNLNLYDSDMNRINSNKPLQGLDQDNKHEKANVREQSNRRSI